MGYWQVPPPGGLAGQLRLVVVDYVVHLAIKCGQQLQREEPFVAEAPASFRFTSVELGERALLSSMSAAGLS